ncbi:hypothetical protein [Chitinophaga parva]|nr:hypothetical protein [Chitinophaga parva]
MEHIVTAGATGYEIVMTAVAVIVLMWKVNFPRLVIDFFTSKGDWK